MDRPAQTLQHVQVAQLALVAIGAKHTVLTALADVPAFRMQLLHAAMVLEIKRIDL
jgi:hypothetical protein